jgi:hypothetical protein
MSSPHFIPFVKAAVATGVANRDAVRNGPLRETIEKGIKGPGREKFSWSLVGFAFRQMNSFVINFVLKGKKWKGNIKIKKSTNFPRFQITSPCFYGPALYSERNPIPRHGDWQVPSPCLLNAPF